MKNLKKILSLVFVALMAFAVVSCSCGKKKSTPTLGTPVAEINGSVISWNAVEHATSYDVSKEGVVLQNVTTTSFDIYSVQIADGTYNFTVVAKADGYNASAASNSVQFSVVNPTALDTVLGTFKNNDAVVIEEVVFAKVEGGFFVSSSVGAIYVNLASYTGSTTVNVGDKVRVAGKFGYVSNFPQIKGVSEVTVKSSGNAVCSSAVASTVAEVKAYAPATIANYAKIVTLQGFVDKNGAVYSLRDEAGNTLAFNGLSNTEALDANVDKRVELNVIVYKYESDAWSVIFNGTAADITPSAIPEATVRELAQADIDNRLVVDCYESLTLPKTHSTIDTIKYAWSVETNATLSITNNKASFNPVTEDTKITITATVTYEEVSFTLNFEVTAHPIVAQTVEEFRNNEPENNGSTVKLTGTIVTFCRNESGTIKGVILVHNGASVQVDFYNKSNSESRGSIPWADEAFTKLEVGDNITVTGSYRNVQSGDRPTVEYPMEVVVNSKGNAIDLGKDKAFELKDAASYKALADDISSYCGKLVKITNPYLSGSSSSTLGNYVRFGYANGQCAGSYGKDSRIFSFYITSVDANVGSTCWRDPLNLEFVGSEKEYAGLTIYAYVSYLGNTVVQFIVPGVYGFESTDVEYMAGLELASFETTYDGNTSATLPATLAGYDVTWTTESALATITGTNCAFGNPAENEQVVVTGTFDTDKKVTIEFTVKSIVQKTYNVSELAGKAAGSYIVQGVVVGITKTTESAAELLLKDAFTNDMIAVTGMGNYSSGYTMGSYTIGQTIKFEATLGTQSDASGATRARLSSPANIETVVIENVVTAFDFSKATVISSQEELVAFFFDGEKLTNFSYKLIKLTGAKSVAYKATTAPADTYHRVWFTATQLSEQKIGASAKLGNKEGGISPSISTMMSYTTQGITVAELNTACGFTDSKSYTESPEELADLYCIVGASTAYYFHLTVVGVAKAE